MMKISAAILSHAIVSEKCGIQVKNMQSLDNAEIVIEWRGRDENEAGKFNEMFH